MSLSALLYSFVCFSLLNSTNKWQYGVLKRIFKFLKEFCVIHHKFKGLPCCSNGKESACIAGVQGSIPGSGRSSGGGNGNPFRCSCLENPTDRWAMVHRAAKSWIRPKQLWQQHTRKQHLPLAHLS